jgi:GNAT superfamily N-acetyltransferase
MLFADLELARRLERAEAFACAQFAAARSRLFPECGSVSTECAGTTLVFDGIGAPTTQSFGLGMFAEPTPDDFAEMEQFFLSRGAEVMHEVCPLAGAAVLQALCTRGYTPFEISNVLYQPVVRPESSLPSAIGIRVVEASEAALWSQMSARGWAHDHPEFEEFCRQAGALIVAREQSACFLAEIDGRPGATGSLLLHEGVALFAGASTVPEMRKRGLQSALLEERMRYAHDQGCDLAMMVAEAGSNSQRNAERQGFRVAYTRLKWKLDSAPQAG